MTTRIPVANTSDKVDRLLKDGRPFAISAKTLSLDLHYFTEQEVDLLRDILINNTTVTTLDISCKEDNLAKAKPLHQITQILQKNKTINSLFIRGTYFAEKNRKKIFSDLSQNKNIKKLLIHSKLGPEDYYSLSEMLKINTTISYISILHETIDEVSVKYLNDALKMNTSLKTLILKANIHRPDLLKEAIIYNTTLRLLHLNMGLGAVTEDTISTVCESIERNIGLESLILIGVDKYTLKILKAFVINNTISNFSSESYAAMLDLTPDDEQWIREIKGLTYTDNKHPLLEEILLQNKMTIKNRKEDLKILLFNVARSSAALELAPIEIWQNIFRFLVYPGIFVGDLAEIIFPKAWTLDFRKRNARSRNNNATTSNRSNGHSNNGPNNNGSRFCALL